MFARIATASLLGLVAGFGNYESDGSKAIMRRTYEQVRTLEGQGEGIDSIGILWEIDATWEPLSFGSLNLTNYFVPVAADRCDFSNNGVVLLAMNVEIAFASDMTISTTKVHSYTEAAADTGFFPYKNFYLPTCTYNATTDEYFFAPLANHWINDSVPYALFPDPGTIEIHLSGQPFIRVPNYDCAL